MEINEDLQITSENVDDVISQIEHDASQPVLTSGPSEQTASNPYEDFKFSWNNKEIVPDSKDKLIKWASMGYDYGQSMNKLKQREQEFNSKFGTYEEIDRAAQENPDWWQHVQNSFNQLQSGNNGAQGNEQATSETNFESSPVFDELQGRLGKIENFMTNWQKQEQAKQKEMEDKELDNQIKGVRETHSDLDWNSFDENGLSLETRILQHAEQNGISNFKTAFRDYMHEDLLGKAKLQGKEEAAKAVQRNKLQGLLGEKPAPLKQFESRNDFKNKSYDDINAEIMQEFGLTN